MPNKPNKSPEEEIQTIFIERGWTLSVAESCTGGALAQRLTRLPGCSGYFWGSVVAYSNDLKVNILGVDKEMIALQGAVSEQVVVQMAKGMQKITNSDYALAVSGIAGPSGGTSDKPVGTIWAAIYEKKGESYSWELRLKGSREEIIQKSIDELLLKLIDWIMRVS